MRGKLEERGFIIVLPREEEEEETKEYINIRKKLALYARAYEK